MIPRIALTDGVVTLRPLQPADAPAMYTAVHESLAELKPWMSWAHDGYSEREACEWIEKAQERWSRGDYYGFAIIGAQRATWLGGCSLSGIHPVYHFCNLGYWVRSSQHGRGFAVRSARLAARFAFERLGLLRVEIVVAVGNTASLRAAEKAGAQREGVLRNRMVVGAQVYDAVMYSLVPQDLE